jgi:hypothetical protein
MILAILCSAGSLFAQENTMFTISKPYTRWWWFASEIDTVDIKYQLDWLKKNNFGGVEMAFVYPYGGDSLTKRFGWLSPEWSHSVAFARKYANQLNLGCDFTFGTLWPFGDSKVPAKDGSLAYHDTISPLSMRLTWEHPVKGRVLNHMDRKAISNYSKRIGKALTPALKEGKSSLFCDSWEVETKQIWTKGFDKVFQKKYGYDIKPFIDSLYSKGFESHYYEYMKLVSDYVLNEFYKPYTDICHSLGAYSRVQCEGAPCDLITAFSLVDIPETEALLYEPNFSRIPASSAALSSKKIISSETFTCAYGWKRWPGPGEYQKKEQIADLKLIADALFANGTNMIVWHGMPYNKQGGSNQFYASVHVGPDSYFADELPQFNNYLAKVSEYMRLGTVYSDIAVYYPYEDALMAVEYPDSLKFPWVWGQYEMRYVHTPEALKGYQPLWINNDMLKKSKLVDGKLVCGDLSFSSLYIDVKYIEEESLITITELVHKGFPVCLAKTPQKARPTKFPFKSMLSNITEHNNVSADFNKINKSKPLIEFNSTDDLRSISDFWIRKADNSYYIFFAAPKAKNLHFPLKYGQSLTDQTITKNIKINLPSITKDVTLTFKPYQSLLLKIDTQGNAEFIDITFNPKTPKKE